MTPSLHPPYFVLALTFSLLLQPIIKAAVTLWLKAVLARTMSISDLIVDDDSQYQATELDARMLECSMLPNRRVPAASRR